MKKHFTKNSHSPYSIAYGREGMTDAKWQRQLAHGLALLPENFVCELCQICKGTALKTERWSMRACSYCEGTGLVQAFNCAATDSQRQQVLNAAAKSLLLERVVVL